MILADTSVWVAHLKNASGHPELIEALDQGVAASHPFVEGELALAGAPTAELLGGVVLLPMDAHREVVTFFSRIARPVRGIGWIDAHLVYSALVNRCALLTRDGAQRRLFESLVTTR